MKKQYFSAYSVFEDIFYMYSCVKLSVYLTKNQIILKLNLQIKEACYPILSCDRSIP